MNPVITYLEPNHFWKLFSKKVLFFCRLLTFAASVPVRGLCFAISDGLHDLFGKLIDSACEEAGGAGDGGDSLGSRFSLGLLVPPHSEA